MTRVSAYCQVQPLTAGNDGRLCLEQFEETEGGRLLHHVQGVPAQHREGWGHTLSDRLSIFPVIGLPQ